MKPTELLGSKAFKWFFKISENDKKFDNALNFVLNYNGEKEHVKVLKTYTVGPKNRVITEPTKEYQEVLDNFTIVLKSIFRSKRENKMFSLFLGLYYMTSQISVKTTKDLMGKLEDAARKYNKENLVRIKFDIRDAFGSTTYFNVSKILRRTIKTNTGSQLIDKLKYLFIDDKLPQGFSTSPLIFNYIQDYITDKLRNYIDKYRQKDSKAYCKYCYGFYSKSAPVTKLVSLARYADDYLLTLEAAPTDCKDHYYVMFYFLNRLFKQYGYRLNPKKFQVNHKAKSTYIRFLGHSITGNNVVNEHRITYKAVHKYKTIGHIVGKYTNPGNIPQDRMFKKMLGYIAYLGSTKSN